jgi:hypothetical protein
MRVIVVLSGLVLGAVLAVPTWAVAGGAAAIAGVSPITGIPAIANPSLPAPPRLPPALVGPNPGIYQRDHRGPDRPHDRRGHGPRTITNIVVFPQPVYVAPNRCWYQGHWTYQWVPQWVAYNAWVDQQQSPDGDWVGGYYERRWYPSGSYQPAWVDGYYDAC